MLSPVSMRFVMLAIGAVLSLVGFGCTSPRALYSLSSGGVGVFNAGQIDALVPALRCEQDPTLAICETDNEIFHARWFVGARNLGVLLRNKTDRPLEILWDQSGYVDGLHSRPHRLVKRDLPEVEPERILLPGATTQLDLYPAGLLTIVKDGFGRTVGLDRQDIFPRTYDASSPRLKGRIFGVFFAVRDQRTTHQIVYPFTIEDVRAEEGS